MSSRSTRPITRTRSASRRSRPSTRPSLLLQSKIQAYVGPELRFAGASPDAIRAIESLGSFVVVRVNPESSLAKDNASACALVDRSSAALPDGARDLILHPYPVTPFHGDYLYHADLADAAKVRFLGKSADAPAACNAKAEGAR